tara:strand:+ start:50 stop:688 length:639 start_codon:yes stop_codon:yes gene_type:complete
MARKEKKYNYIYKTTNLKNEKFYVGMHSTDNLNDGYLGSGTRLRRSIRKNGIEHFKIEFLEFFDTRTELANREKELVNEDLIKDEMCLNLKPGGQGGLVDAEHARKFKEGSIKWNKAQWENPEYREKISLVLRNNMKENHRLGKIKYDGMKGKNISEEHKRKIGEANKIKQSGSANSQFGTCWITNGTENKKIYKGDLIPLGWITGRNTKIE